MNGTLPGPNCFLDVADRFQKDLATVNITLPGPNCFLDVADRFLKDLATVNRTLPTRRAKLFSGCGGQVSERPGNSE